MIMLFCRLRFKGLGLAVAPSLACVMTLLQIVMRPGQLVTKVASRVTTSDVGV